MNVTEWLPEINNCYNCLVCMRNSCVSLWIYRSFVRFHLKVHGAVLLVGSGLYGGVPLDRVSFLTGYIMLCESVLNRVW